MTPRRRFEAAAAMTFLVWLVPLGLSAPGALQGTQGLWRWVGHHPEGAAVLWEPGAGPAVELLHRTAARDGDGLVSTLLVSLAVMALLHPWLSMAWLAAMERPTPLRRSLRLGLARYVPALGATLLVTAVALVALTVAMAPAVAAHLLLRAQPNDRLHDLVVAVAALPVAVVWVLVPMTHDLARSFIAHGTRRPVRAVRRAVGTLRFRLVAVHLGYRLAGGALAVAAVAVALFPTTGATALASVVVLGQLAALARTAVRARWLALAVHRTRPIDGVTPGSGFPGPLAAGSTPPTR